MILLELLNSSTDFRVTKNTDRDVRTTFESNGRTIEADAEMIRDGIWEFAFAERKHRHSRFDLSSSKLNVTGSGGELEVFSTIVEIMKMIIKEKSPTELRFTAEKSEASRVKLYDKLINRIKVPGYDTEIDKTASDYRVYYSLKKH